MVQTKTGAIAYVTIDDAINNTATEKVDLDGYYVFDGTQWNPLGNAESGDGQGADIGKIQVMGAYDPNNILRSGIFEFRMAGGSDNLTYQMRIIDSFCMNANVTLARRTVAGISSPNGTTGLVNSNGDIIFTPANKNSWQNISQIFTEGAAHFTYLSASGTDLGNSKSFFVLYVQRVGGNSGTGLKTLIVNRY